MENVTCTDHVKNEKSITQSQGVKESCTCNKIRKANRTGHILYRNFFLKHITKGKLDGRIDMTVRREERRKQVMDALKKTKSYCKLKEEVPDLTWWRTGFGRGYGYVVRHTTE